MPAPTAHALGKRLLREGFGVRSLDATTPTDQAATIEDGDLDDIAGIMTQAFQEIDDLSPAETRVRPGSCYLNGPTVISVVVTQGSTTISSLTTYAAWMLGCTIRIDGDVQDNELLTETLLARPYNGTSGTKAGTIYGDCVQLDDTVGEIIGPMLLNNQIPIQPADTREAFLRLGNYPMLTDGSGVAINFGLPFFFFASTKPVSNRPLIYFIDSLYTSSLDYVPRKIRFSPMPSTPLSVGYTAGVNPVRILATDIDSGDHSSDPGVTLPMIDGKVESIFMPIALQILTRHPKFKNQEGKAEIGRSYQMAVGRLTGSRGQRGATNTVFH